MTETTIFLDREGQALWDDRGRRFAPRERTWTRGHAPSGMAAIDPATALRWLQRDSGAPCRVPVGVIGGRDAGPQAQRTAEAVGAGLAGLGLTLLCGGREGVMAAACKGAQQAGGLSIGLLPDDDWNLANPYVGVPIASGLGVARNAIIARAALCLIAVGGGYGTLSEIAFGLQFGRPVFALEDAPEVEGIVRCADWPALEPRLCALVLGLA